MANEQNPLPYPGYHSEDRSTIVGWDDPSLDKITRLRLLTDKGFPFFDVSYCHGVLKDGTLCRVGLPFSQLPRKGLSRAIVQAAKKDGVHAKRLGVFDNLSILW